MLMVGLTSLISAKYPLFVEPLSICNAAIYAIITRSTPLTPPSMPLRTPQSPEGAS